MYIYNISIEYISCTSTRYIYALIKLKPKEKRDKKNYIKFEREYILI